MGRSHLFRRIKKEFLFSAASHGFESQIIKLGAEGLQQNVILKHKVFDRSLGFHRFELGD